jgi:hypothetical protein
VTALGLISVSLLGAIVGTALEWIIERMREE